MYKVFNTLNNWFPFKINLKANYQEIRRFVNKKKYLTCIFLKETTRYDKYLAAYIRPFHSYSKNNPILMKYD